ncbi:MAG: flagellar assembly protein FliX [Bradyrhizobium sp.]|jgi:hypothetical protein
MRISGPNGTTLGSQTSSVRRPSSGGFSLPEDAASASETRATLAPNAATGIDALLAMQGIEEDPVERRKRSVQRGKRALDVLDDLKIGLLAGNFDTSTVSRLREAAANLKSSSGDPGLDTVLSEIELRVEVELAKAGQH